MPLLLLTLLFASPTHAADAPRVMVLAPSHDVDAHAHPGLQRKVRARLEAPGARFHPGTDLYQAGRVAPNRTTAPLDQPVWVSEPVVDELVALTAELSERPWSALSAEDWHTTAHALRKRANNVFFLDRPELRQVVFDAYVQIGRAAENSNNPVPPFFEEVGDRAVNYYWYQAAAMAHVEPSLTDGMDKEVIASVLYYKDQLDRGAFPPMTLSFERAGAFDPAQFASETQLFIDGLEVLVTDPRGLVNVPPGRTDVWLVRPDGSALSDTLHLDKAHIGQTTVYFVRDTAAVQMEQLGNQLLEDTCELVPERGMANYLSIYSQLNPAPLYLTLAGERRPTLWRYDTERGVLNPVDEGCP